MKKIKEWFNRYKYAEGAGLLFFVFGSILCHALSIHPLQTSIALTYIEFIGFYLGMLCFEFSTNNLAWSWKNILQTTFKLGKEFGLAEIIDLSFSRSFCLWLGMYLCSANSFGLVLGKICADLVFYFLTISCYEYSKLKTS
jgi:hypothetical protein